MEPIVMKPMEPIEFGNYLKSLRNQRKLSIRNLDKLSGVSHSYISKLEAGIKGIPSPDILKKLAAPLGGDFYYYELMKAAGYVTVLPLPDEFESDRRISPAADILMHALYDFIEVLKTRSKPAQLDQLGHFIGVFRELTNGAGLDLKPLHGMLYDQGDPDAPLVGSKGDTAFLSGLLNKLQRIFEQDDSSRQQFAELTHYLDQPGITYMHQPVSQEDVQRIRDMLKLLMPNYHSM